MKSVRRFLTVGVDGEVARPGRADHRKVHRRGAHRRGRDTLLAGHLQRERPPSQSVH